MDAITLPLIGLERVSLSPLSLALVGGWGHPDIPPSYTYILHDALLAEDGKPLMSEMDEPIVSEKWSGAQKYVSQ